MESVEPPQIVTRGKRVVRVKRRVNQASTAQQLPEAIYVAKSTKNVRIARKVLKVSDEPLPGSLEDDLLLENGSAADFLCLEPTDEEEFAPKFDSNGRVYESSVIGPADLFESKYKENFQQLSSASSKPELSINPTTTRKPLFNTKRATSAPEDPIMVYENKMKRIEEGSRLEERLRQEYVEGLPNGLRILEERQSKILEKFEASTKRWEKYSAELAARVGKDPSQLVVTRAQEYREKVEEMDFLDRAISSEEKAGSKVWYMSLRADKRDERATFVPVGNTLSGLYTKVKERSQTAEAIIRRPGAVKSSTKTFRDNPYFQKRQAEENKKKALRPVNCTDAEHLTVEGVGKLGLEVSAAQEIGLEYLRPELVEGGVVEEEILAMQFDRRLKY
jgi:hypothetical protein